MSKLLSIGLGLIVLILGFVMIIWFQPGFQKPSVLPSPTNEEAPANTASPVPPENETLYADLLIVAQNLETLSKAQLETAKNAPFADPVRMDEYRSKFDQFRGMVAQEAKTIDQNHGAHDLACIFRGMAADTARKLEALSTARTMGEQAVIWQNAADLFADVKAVLVPGEQDEIIHKYAGETCPAEPVTD